MSKLVERETVILRAVAVVLRRALHDLPERSSLTPLLLSWVAEADQLLAQPGLSLV